MQRKQKAFLEAYKLSAGNKSKAAECAGIDRSQHYRWLEEEEYRTAFAKAEQEAAQAIEDEAIRRAVEGVERPVIHRGQVVRVPMIDAAGNPVLDDEGNPVMKPLMEREYSDSLMQSLLKGWMPQKYGRTEITGPNGGPIEGKIEVVFVKP